MAAIVAAGIRQGATQTQQAQPTSSWAWEAMPASPASSPTSSAAEQDEWEPGSEEEEEGSEAPRSSCPSQQSEQHDKDPEESAAFMAQLTSFFQSRSRTMPVSLLRRRRSPARPCREAAAASVAHVPRSKAA